jgi:hypothetical protein
VTVGALLAVCGAANGAPGDLDTSFSGGVTLFTHEDNGGPHVWALALQQDGRIVAAGHATAFQPNVGTQS